MPNTPIMEADSSREPLTNDAFISPAKPKTVLREYVEQFLITVVMALFLMTFITQAVQVPTGSMQNNIHIGDHFFVNKFIFGSTTPIIGKLLPTREIKRGDVIVFKFPDKPQVNYVKRVIGLPGDTVEVKDTTVFVNGQALPEQQVSININSNVVSAQPELKTDPAPPGSHYKVYLDSSRRGMDARAKFGVGGPVTVPANSYFAMGDSRDNSEDSRYWGFVPRSNIIGHALYVYWSYNPTDDEREHSNNPISDILMHSNWRRTGTAIK